MMDGAEAAGGSHALEVHIDRTQQRAISVPSIFETSRDFPIEITNAGEPIHVYLTCDDDLTEAIEFDTGNHFIPRKSTYRIPVDLRDDAEPPVRGKFKLSVGYGAETAYADLRIVEPSPTESVRVDESLATPPTREQPEEAEGMSIDPLSFAAIGVGIAAVIGGIVLVGLLTDPLIGVIFAIAVLVIASAVFVLTDT